jgi:hypothetical protein
MDGLSILDPTNWRVGGLKEHPAYIVGNAAAWLTKAGAVGTNHYLTGRLYVAKSGWLLLSVPNALVRGVFDAMTATGAELPTMSAFNGESADKELLNAHISVMTAEEVEQIGADKINERGHNFHYALGQIREFSPRTETLSRVWAIQVASPELAALRKSYGLSALPNGDHPFHITVAVRRKNVLGQNEVAKVNGSRGALKAAADHTVTYDCGCSGPCSCPDTCICKQSGRCGSRNKAAAKEDVLHGGAADHKPDSEFNPEALSEGKTHEREHTDNDQIAKEIAADHLSEDPAYYKKVRQIEKGSSVYFNQARQMFNPFTVSGPQIPYDHNRPVFENIQNQLAEVKRRGDFMLQADRNHQIWRAQLDPNYRYQLALQAFRGELPQPGLTDQLFERYGDGMLASLQPRRP